MSKNLPFFKDLALITRQQEAQEIQHAALRAAREYDDVASGVDGLERELDSLRASLTRLEQEVTTTEQLFEQANALANGRATGNQGWLDWLSAAPGQICSLTPAQRQLLHFMMKMLIVRAQQAAKAKGAFAGFPNLEAMIDRGHEERYLKLHAAVKTRELPGAGSAPERLGMDGFVYTMVSGLGPGADAPATGAGGSDHGES